CIKAGLVTGEVMVTDSTHIKAYASSERTEVVSVIKTPSEYIQSLHEEAKKIEKELQEKRRGKTKSGRKKSEDMPEREVKRSLTDPDSGLLGRPNKPKGFHYLAHTTVDTAYGIITDIHVTQGNINDHEPYVERLAVQKEKFGLHIQQVGADRGYDVSHVHKKLEELGITGYISAKKQERKSDAFVYQAETDTFLCPFQKTLQFTHLNWKKEYQKYMKVYATKTKDCRECPFRTDCLSKTAKHKQLSKPLFHEYGLSNQLRNQTEKYKKVRQLRNTWAEGTFGTLKQCHTLTKTYFRGISKNQVRCLFSALALNLKRMVNALS
ncbi:transposase, partial [Bacillus sp. CGMCC 1.60114]|uniref:transposase n=1 Tax=unclassified Bacillus (in: firmicutes) TaxID=185979 RepID=UPI0036294683